MFRITWPDQNESFIEPFNLNIIMKTLAFYHILWYDLTLLPCSTLLKKQTIG